jgi:hypothetical protein
MNSTLRLPRERVLALNPADLEAYLLVHGWEADDRTSTPDVGVYHLTADPAVVIEVLRDKTFVDYALRVSELIAALAAVERRKAWEVLEDLQARQQGSSSNGASTRRRRRAETKQNH